jgi:hypothetical protein
MPPIRPSPARLVLATPLPRGPVRSIPCCYRSANKLLQTNPQAVDKLCSHCLFPVVVTSLEQAVNNLKQAWWHYQTCYKVVLTSLIRSWYNKNVTRLTTQGCNNIVISWLYRTCWNNLATSLIMSSNLLQVVNCSLFQTCWQLVTTSLILSGLLQGCLQPCVVNLVTFLLYHDCIRLLLEQPCNKFDATKVVTS